MVSELTIAAILAYQENLPEYALFFDDLVVALQEQELKDYNFISFLFGEAGANETNEMLFAYEGETAGNKRLTFVFSKVYEAL